MATLTVYNASGGEVGTYEIDTEQIADRINKQLLHDVVVMYNDLSELWNTMEDLNIDYDFNVVP